MQHLSIKNLHFKYKNSSLPIFENLNLKFEKRWSCLVGPNGSGKSTLLKLISNEIQAQYGTIKGNSLTYYCTQTTQYSPKNFSNFIFSFSAKSFKIKEMLGIEEFWVNQWNSLSCGEKKRAQLGAALFQEPDVLLVDEPTNHLDSQNRNIIMKALRSFNGIGVLVSHDRKLLSFLSQCTIILKVQGATIINSTYENAIIEHEKSIDFLEKTHIKQSNELKKIKKIIQLQQEKVSQSKKRFSKKNINKGDNDSKNKINLAKLTSKDKNDGQVVKKLQSKQKQLQFSFTKCSKTYEVGIKLNAKKSKNIFPIVIKKSILNLSKLKKLSFEILNIYEHDKIGIIGKNGSGKSWSGTLNSY